VFEPVVAGKDLFLGFNDTDKLVAIDVETGELLWVSNISREDDDPMSAMENAVDDLTDQMHHDIKKVMK